MGLKSFLIHIHLVFLSAFCSAQIGSPTFVYSVSIPDPATHLYQIELHTSGWDQDTVLFMIPAWMPGYYQIMNYSEDVINMVAEDGQGNEIPLNKVGNHSWQVTDVRNKELTITYDIRTKRQFVANSYVDSLHAYIVPANSFLYVEGYIHFPESVRINHYSGWSSCHHSL